MEMEEEKTSNLNCTPWISLFKESVDAFNGSVDTLEECIQLIKKFELATCTHYTIVNKTKDLGSCDLKTTKHKILWSEGNDEKLKRVPFCVLGKMRMECQNGPDRNKAIKEKNKSSRQRLAEGDHNFQKSRLLLQTTKKLNCPAVIQVRDIAEFTTFQMKLDSKHRRESTSKKIREEIQSDKIEWERKIYISLPKPEKHENHLVGSIAGVQMPMDNKIKAKIRELVSWGVSDVREMERHLIIYVENELFAGEKLTEKNNRRFYPLRCDIRNYMYMATEQLRYSKLDEEELLNNIQKWKEECPEDNFFFRAHSVSTSLQEGEFPSGDEIDMGLLNVSDEQHLLFVHQTKWQHNLLRRYGGEICLLDATYKTTKYSLPLFFICVKTNVDYSVVGSFICQYENTESIIEALRMIKSWNEDWHPQYMMADFCEAEINAIENVFPDCLVYLCDFHREQAWERWSRTSVNNVNREQLLPKLRRIAKASTQSDYQSAVNDLKESEIWQANKSLQNWFGKTWLPVSKRWVKAYWKERFNVLINTNNGVERQNRTLKHDYLRSQRDKSLSNIVRVIVKSYLPDSYRRTFMGHVSASRKIEHRQWKLASKDHSKQLDGYNCGMYCLMFAERHLDRKPATNITRGEITQKRKEVATSLLLYEVYLESCCPCCGFQTDSGSLIQCSNCNRSFHRKTHCVGVELAESRQESFICAVCLQDTKKMRIHSA